MIGDVLKHLDDHLKGPFLSVQLPFVRGTRNDHIPAIPLPFTPYAHQERAF